MELITNNLDVWTSAKITKNTVGRGSNGKQTAYGIKKLRELILELAVRGKLVPQDPNDEPASVLLEKIAKEKTRLIKEGKIKKQTPLSEISKEGKPFELPENWKWTRLGTISLINPRNDAEDKILASFVPMTLITTSHTGEHGQEEREWGSIKTGYTHFSDGDIGLAKITPCFENSKAVVFSNLKKGIGAGTTELHIARPYGDTLCARYILLYLKAPEFLLIGETKMTGTAGQKRVPKDFFAENPLPLPPLAEQYRIVAKVDELMALCDQLEQQQTDSNAAHQTLVETLLGTLANPVHPELVEGCIASTSSARTDFEEAWQRIAKHFETLFTTEHSIDRLKQTILQLAIMGKLVPQDPDDEPARVLLKKIAEEKARLVKEGKIKKQNPLPEITEMLKTFELPKGWEITRFGELFNLVSGQHLKPQEYSESFEIGMIPYLTGPAEFGEKHPLATRYTFERRAVANPGDVLVTCKGSGVGKLNEVDTEIAISRQLMSIQPIRITTKFTKLLVNSLYEQLRVNIVGIAIPGISREDVTEIIIALPPIEEQHRIVAKVDELMALCDALKAHLNEAQTTQVHLADAIVEQAVA